MQPNSVSDPVAAAPGLVVHPLTQEDFVAVGVVGFIVAPMNGDFEGTARRRSFDDIVEQAPVPEGVASEPASVGQISG